MVAQKFFYIHSGRTSFPVDPVALPLFQYLDFSFFYTLSPDRNRLHQTTDVNMMDYIAVQEFLFSLMMQTGSWRVKKAIRSSPKITFCLFQLCMEAEILEMPKILRYGKGSKGEQNIRLEE